MAIKGLFELLGWWKWVVITVTAAAGFVASLWLTTPPIVRILAGLAIFALLLVCVMLATALKQMSAIDANKQSAANITLPLDRPQIVIEYSHEERGPFSTVNQQIANDPNAPLILRNMSASRTAYNVRVLPLIVEGQTAAFKPALIQFIGHGDFAAVHIHIPDDSVFFNRSVFRFLRKFYKDSSVDELMSDRIFTLVVEYDDGAGLNLTTSCQLLYRPWKDRVRMGAIEHKVRGSAAGA